jgi:hypothetical protein
MTFATRISENGDSLRLCYAIVIQGIPMTFLRGSTTVTSDVLALSGFGTSADFDRVARHGGVADFELGTKSIDPKGRRMVGGSFRFSIVDDEDNTARALLSMRIRRATFLRVAKTALDSGTLEVSSSAGLAASGFVYLGGETIHYFAKTAGPDSIQVLAAGRGQLGSRATAHAGATENGTSVFTQPPNWIGRRVKVIAFFVEDTGSIVTGEAQVIDTFRIESNPKQPSTGVFEFTCSHLSDEVATRQLGVGLDPVRILYEPFPTTTGTSFSFAVEKTRKFDSALAYPTYVSFSKTSVGYSVHKLTTSSQQVGYTDLQFSFRNLVDGSTSSDAAGAESCRHIAILNGGPAGVLALMALTSIQGDAANGSYDLLAGYTDTTLDGLGYRFGAGIHSSEVDTNSFLNIGEVAPWFSFVINEQIPLADFLRDFCLATDSFWFVDNNGQLKVAPYAQNANTSSFTLTDIVGDPIVTVEEDSIIPRLELECNYNHLTGKYAQKISLFDNEVIKRYPSREDVYQVKSRSIHLSPSNGPPDDKITLPTLSLGQIENIYRRFQYEDSRGRLVVQIMAPLSILASATLGSIVSVGFSANDFSGGDILGTLGRIVSMSTRLDEGLVELELHIIERTSAIAPSAIISGVAADIYTLASGQFNGDDNTGSPALMFAPIGSYWNCLIFDVSTGARHMTYATTLTATTVQLGAVPAFAISLNNDFITIAEMPNRDDSFLDNAAGFGVDDFIYQQPDNEVLTINTFQTRWR